MEIELPGYYAKMLSVPKPAGPGETTVLRVHIASGLKKAVIERDTDNLTPDEIKNHHDEAVASMLKELMTWAKYKCFSRRPRTGAQNIIDCRWVIKWKSVEEDV